MSPAEVDELHPRQVVGLGLRLRRGHLGVHLGPVACDRGPQRSIGRPAPAASALSSQASASSSREITTAAVAASRPASASVASASSRVGAPWPASCRDRRPAARRPSRRRRSRGRPALSGSAASSADRRGLEIAAGCFGRLLDRLELRLERTLVGLGLLVLGLEHGQSAISFLTGQRPRRRPPGGRRPPRQPRGRSSAPLVPRPPAAPLPPPARRPAMIPTPCMLSPRDLNQTAFRLP